MVLYYRKDLFKEFDIKPEDLKTWKDFADVGRELQSDHGQRFMALDGTLFDVLLRQKGTDLFDKKEIFYRTKKKHLKYWRNLQKCPHLRLR